MPLHIHAISVQLDNMFRINRRLTSQHERRQPWKRPDRTTSQHNRFSRNRIVFLPPQHCCIISVNPASEGCYESGDAIA